MTNRLENRLTRLEQRAASPWAALEGVPVSEWPDEALDAKIRDGWGLPPDAELNNELLGSLIAQAREEGASDDPEV